MGSCSVKFCISGQKILRQQDFPAIFWQPKIYGALLLLIASTRSRRRIRLHHHCQQQQQQQQEGVIRAPELRRDLRVNRLWLNCPAVNNYRAPPRTTTKAISLSDKPSVVMLDATLMVRSNLEVSFFNKLWTTRREIKRKTKKHREEVRNSVIYGVRTRCDVLLHETKLKNEKNKNFRRSPSTACILCQQACREVIFLSEHTEVCTSYGNFLNLQVIQLK